MEKSRIEKGFSVRTSGIPMFSSFSRKSLHSKAAGSSSASGGCLPRSYRITKSDVFRQAFEQGKRYHGKLMVLYLLSDDDVNLRLGVVVGKARFRKASDRSRAKRLLREAYRLNRDRFCGMYDVVLSAKPGILKVSRGEVEEDLIVLADKAGILKKEC